MDIAQALALGALQGLTEWLPISSSAQTFLTMVNLLGLEPGEALNLAFFLHVGSFFAVLLYFRGEIAGILEAFRREDWLSFNFESRSSSLASFIFFSTLTTAIVGLPVYFLLEKALATYSSKANLLVGVALIATGLLLYFSRAKRSSRSAGAGTLSDMLVAGAAQGIAVVPGISRSGMTVAALIFRGFHHGEALRISFLMALPAIAGVSILESFRGLGAVPLDVLLAGVASSLVFSIIGIKFLLEAARKLRFEYFCWLFGALAVVFSI